MKDVLTFENPWPKHFEGELNGYENYVGTAIFKNSKFDMSKMGPPPGEGGEGSEGDGPPAGKPMENPLSLTEAVAFTHELTKKLGGEFVFGITGDYLENGRNRPGNCPDRP